MAGEWSVVSRKPPKSVEKKTKTIKAPLRRRQKLAGAARRMGVLDQCLEHGYNPAEALIKARIQAQEHIKELMETLRIGAPPPIESRTMGEIEGTPTKHDRTNTMKIIYKLEDYVTDIDKELMPYCYPKLKQIEIEETSANIEFKVDENSDPSEVVTTYIEFMKSIKV